MKMPKELEMTPQMRSEHMILIVDDEPHIRRLIQVNLERVGYRTKQACDGQQCLDEVSADHPDLILLDWMMPVKDGMTTMGDLQAGPKTKDIPVIFLTAMGQDKNVFDGWSAGAWAYITKPFNPREVLAFVDRIILGKRNPDIDQPGGEIYDV